MPEEKFHAQFGRDFCTELCQTEAGRAKVQQAIGPLLISRMMLPFFGRADSENNALFRRCGIKQHTNTAMREDFIGRARAVVEDHLKLRLPEVREAA